MGCGGLILVACSTCGLILVVLVIVVGGDSVDFGFLAMVVSDGWLILGGGGFPAVGLWWWWWLGGWVGFKLFNMLDGKIEYLI